MTIDINGAIVGIKADANFYVCGDTNEEQLNTLTWVDGKLAGDG